MPIYQLEHGEHVMRSLQNIAPFSQDVATYLDSSALRVEKEMLGSIAATFAEGRYVSSGLTFGPMFPPRNKPQVIWRTCAAVVLLGFVIPLVGANLPCVSCCWTYHGGLRATV